MTKGRSQSRERGALGPEERPSEETWMENRKQTHHID